MSIYRHALRRLGAAGRACAFVRPICRGLMPLFAHVVAVLILLSAAPAHAVDKADSKRPSVPGTNVTDPGDEGGGGSSTPRIPSFFEQGIPIRSGEVIQPLGPNLMGDTLNEFSGGLAFSHTDVELPGNNALRVAVGRQLATGTRQAALNAGLFGDWDLEIPRLHTLAFNAQPDWYGSNGTGSYNQSRCSQLAPPPYTTYVAGNRTVGLYPERWWGGYRLYVPGSGDQILLNRAPRGAGPVNPIQPDDGAAYPVLTKQHWQLSCLPVMERGSGEGFVALAPDGTRYRFDHMVQRAYPGLNTVGYGTVPRMEIWILPTQVTDRFGNWVRYNYAGADGWRVASIASSDGRVISFTYNGWSNRIQSVSDGTRTWNYGYDGNGALQTVTQPDGAQWRFDLTALERDPFSIHDPGCGDPPPSVHWDPITRVGNIVHPSGATGRFSLKMTMHGRTNVPGSEEACLGPSIPAIQANLVSRYFASYSLIDKTLSGPGMPTMTWRYAYSEAGGDWAPSTGSKTVTITDPNNHITEKTYGTAYGVNDGLLLSSRLSQGAAVLQSVAYSYRSPNAGPYPALVGYDGSVSDAMGAIHTPMNQRSITQQAATFTRTVTDFDEYARPRSLTRASSLNFSRSESTTYFDQRSLWVLGQVSSHTVAGRLVEETEFDLNTALPKVSRKFGLPVSWYGFHADGNLASVTDGLNHTTTFTNWKRGLPQNIGYADGTGISGVVHDIGVLASTTNEAGLTWTYRYDAMGRLSSKTPPGGDAVTYHPTTLAFEQVASAEYGLEPGHWRQTIVTGSAVTANYFDARWRKRLSTTYDANNRAATERVQRFDYDPYNRTTFASFPASAINSIFSPAPGTTTQYDALGRTTAVTVDGGGLTTRTDYLDGFLRQVTSPRGSVSVSAFEAYDQPSEDMIRTAWLPEGAAFSIKRDAFGKPTFITRSGPGVNVTRSYVYDAYERLCKSIEPETGVTVQQLDVAGNVIWHASGLNLPGAASCDQDAVPGARKVSSSYDERNRPLSTSYGDGAPGTTRTYTPDGLPATVVSPGTVWTYRYNNRRLLTQEIRTDPGQPLEQGWNFVWGVDAYGHVNALTDPWWGTVTYAPNALGQPTQVSGYASNVTYHPNGAVAGYDLANGVHFSLGLNQRGLPQQWQYGAVVNDSYSYDADANVSAITDNLEASNSRTMPWYDGLNRLRQANGIWGQARYDYDAVDNLTYSQVGGRTLHHNINPASNRLDSLSGSQNIGMAYDANGNVTQRGGQSFVFDIGNRLANAPGKAGYTYDGHGRRAWIQYADGSARLHAYSQNGKLLLTWHTSGAGTRYVYLGDKLIAETSNATGPLRTTYVMTDALGSPVARTDEAGNVLSRTRYEPYGATAAETNPTGIGFTGHVNDADTGLVYMQQRYYDPVAGRFLSVDPVTTDASTGGHFGRYHYANNSPYLYVDPDGRESVAEYLESHGVRLAKEGKNKSAYAVAMVGVFWDFFGAESLSQIVDQGGIADFGQAVAAGGAIIGALPVGRIGSLAAKGAQNIANGSRLAQQLAHSEAASIFINGGLRAEVIAGSKVAIPGGQLNNPAVVKALTADGSKIADWAKMTTQTFNSPSGPFQVHFYQNLKTGATHFGDDFKVVFNHNGVWP